MTERISYPVNSCFSQPYPSGGPPAANSAITECTTGNGISQTSYVSSTCDGTALPSVPGLYIVMWKISELRIIYVIVFFLTSELAVVIPLYCCCHIPHRVVLRKPWRSSTIPPYHTPQYNPNPNHHTNNNHNLNLSMSNLCYTDTLIHWHRHLHEYYRRS